MTTLLEEKQFEPELPAPTTNEWTERIAKIMGRKLDPEVIENLPSAEVMAKNYPGGDILSVLYANYVDEFCDGKTTTKNFNNWMSNKAGEKDME